MNMKSRSIIILAVCAILYSALAPMPCSAQADRAVDRPISVYPSLGKDIECYQITPYLEDKEYAAYSDIVRERIREAFRSRRIRYYRGGDVNLLFIIRSDGQLVKYDIDHKNSTGNARLIDIALSGLNGASPFPPFPKNLAAAELPFSIIISFEEKR